MARTRTRRTCYHKVRGRYVTARQASRLRRGRHKKRTKSAWPQRAYAGMGTYRYSRHRRARTLFYTPKRRKKSYNYWKGGW